MRAATYVRPDPVGHLVIGEVPEPIPGPGEALAALPRVVDRRAISHVVVEVGT